MSYVATRLALVPPTLAGILAINILVAQCAPGGPVEAAAARIAAQHAAARAAIRHQLGYDRPPLARVAAMLRGYATFDLGRSLATGQPVIRMILGRLPVSIALGLAATLLAYAVAIPLGIAKAVRHGSRFDIATSLALAAGVAIPSFLLAVFLILLFAQGGAWPVLPLAGLGGPAPFGVLRHLVLPVAALTAGSFASLTFLTKAAVMTEAEQLYLLAARARGLGPTQALIRHGIRNAILPLAAGLPAAFVGLFFTSALIVEIVFSIPGLGQLGYQAIEARDYPVMFGTLTVYSLASLLARLAGDLLYAAIDPRIDFGRTTA